MPPPTPTTTAATAPTTIADVIACLDAEVDRSRREGDRLGYFAALYRGVTREVARGIAASHFADGTRMERLDVCFASRYLEALGAWRAGRPTSRAWAAAFESARWSSLLALQHLLLGMNAHINLDLGIAAATTSPGTALGALHADFLAINGVLASMIDDAQARIERFSPWMTVLDRIGCRTDEAICSFCIDQARDVAWRSASALAALDGDARAREIARIDDMVTLLALPIRTPPFFTRAMLWAVHLRESGDVRRVIDALAE